MPDYHVCRSYKRNTHPSLTGCLECVMERIYPRSATPARPGARIHPPGLWAYRPAPKVHGLVFEFARRWDTPLLFFLGKSPIDQCDILRRRVPRWCRSWQSRPRDVAPGRTLGPVVDRIYPLPTGIRSRRCGPRRTPSRPGRCRMRPEGACTHRGRRC